jgi:hypothetical protein
LGAFLTHSLDFCNVLNLQGVKVGTVPNKTVFKQCGNDLRSETFNIHRALGGKVLKAARELCGAGGICAPYCSAIIVVANYGLAAGGTVRWHKELDLTSVTKLGVSAKHLGNDVAGFSYRYRVTEHNTAFPDEIKIVQRRA